MVIYKMSMKRACDYSPLVLAYIGDSVYEQYVRCRIVTEHPDMPAHKLHKAAIHYVSAEAQSRSIGNIEEMLTEEELAVYKRGRNAKSPTSAKNASITDYRRATGFEALVGYLFFNNSKDRLDAVMKAAFEHSMELQ